MLWLIVTNGLLQGGLWVTAGRGKRVGDLGGDRRAVEGGIRSVSAKAGTQGCTEADTEKYLSPHFVIS